MESKNFWDLISEYKICIPIIQRDYAQGRKDAKLKRQSFLRDIMNGLNKGTGNNMEFVYGKEVKEGSGKTFYPLDGQQRLTTLWLIHWFLAFKGNAMDIKINDSGKTVGKILMRFSYETRSSSREFCESLCSSNLSYEDYVNEVSSRKKDDPFTLSDYIKDRIWFFSEWKLDPTIDAMLRTISGDKSIDDDNLENIFTDYDAARCMHLIREIAIDRNKDARLGKLTFELIPIGEDKLPVSDDLYVKMNSRGKELTGFEDFKNKLDEWMKSAKNGFKPGEKADILKNIDQTWTDVIWNGLKSSTDVFSDGFDIYMNHAFDDSDNTELRDKYPKNFIIDESLYVFIKKYLMNSVPLMKELSELKPNKFKSISRDKDNNIDKKLYAFELLNNMNGEGLFQDVYEPVLTYDSIMEINSIFEKLHLISDLDSSISNELTNVLRLKDRVYYLIPFKKASDGKTIPVADTYGFVNQLYFYAVTQYINSIDPDKHPKDRKSKLYDEEKVNLKRWLRFARNVIENCDSGNDGSEYAKVLRCLSFYSKGLSDNGGLFAYIRSNKPKSEDSLLNRQLIEESEKADYILSQNEDAAKISKIFDAENYGFFKGSIRALYRNVNDRSHDWDQFDTKSENAKNLFDASENSVSADTLVKFLKKFKSFDEFIEYTRDSDYKKTNPENKLDHFYAFPTTFFGDFRGTAWMQTFLWGDKNPKVRSKIDDLLLDPNRDNISDQEFRDFVESNGLIDQIVSSQYYIEGERNPGFNWKRLVIAEKKPGKYVNSIPIRWDNIDYKQIGKQIEDFKNDKVTYKSNEIEIFGEYYLTRKILFFEFDSYPDKKFGWHLGQNGEIHEKDKKYDDKNSGIKSPSWSDFKNSISCH